MRSVFERHAHPIAQSLARENLHARIRGVLMMVESNDTGALLISCGNETEIALGYATLYGDMCGGMSLIGDLSKTDVYGLSRYVNRKHGREIIPSETLHHQAVRGAGGRPVRSVRLRGGGADRRRARRAPHQPGATRAPLRAPRAGSRALQAGRRGPDARTTSTRPRASARSWRRAAGCAARSTSACRARRSSSSASAPSASTCARPSSMAGKARQSGAGRPRSAATTATPVPDPLSRTPSRSCREDAAACRLGYSRKTGIDPNTSARDRP